jgi:hypothetical protein
MGTVDKMGMGQKLFYPKHQSTPAIFGSPDFTRVQVFDPYPI